MPAGIVQQAGHTLDKLQVIFGEIIHFLQYVNSMCYCVICDTFRSDFILATVLQKRDRAAK